MHPEAVEWRDTTLFNNVPNSASVITLSCDLRHVAEIQQVALQCPHYVELANLSADVLKDSFSCRTRASPGRIFWIEATVSLRDFITYMCYELSIGGMNGMSEDVVYGALYLLRKIKHISPKLKCTYGHRLFLASTIVSQSHILSSPVRNKHFVKCARYFYTEQQIDRFKAEFLGFLLNENPFDSLDPVAVTHRFRCKLYAKYGDSAGFVLSYYSEGRNASSNANRGQSFHFQHNKSRDSKSRLTPEGSADDAPANEVVVQNGLCINCINCREEEVGIAFADWGLCKTCSEIIMVSIAESRSQQGESSTADESSSTVDRGGLCVICQEEEAEIAVVDCGHLCLCRGCSERLMTETRECPLCRTRIRSDSRLLKIFKT